MKKRPRLTRRLEATVRHRGRERKVIVEIDKAAGTIAVRLAGCHVRRTYHAADLWLHSTPQLALSL